ncbi:MAG: ribosomal protein S18-alanine N-acetyltransferase [Oscillospiraceae bacterium]
MDKVIFVCNGNTCRSPMAEIMFKKYLRDNNINDLEVSSLGICASTGDKAAENAIEAVKEAGEDLTSHIATQLKVEHFEKDAFFVCMTQRQAIRLEHYTDKRRILILNIPDPFCQSLDVYRDCLKTIINSFPDIINWLNSYMKINRMAECHISTIADIEKECFTSPWSENSLREELTNPTSRFLVCVQNHKVLGYIGANNISKEVFITNVAVGEKFRNIGVATMLIQKLIEISVFEEAYLITLEVRESNTSAISLYEKNGFEKVGKRKKFYTLPTEGAVIMTKYLID